MKILKNFYIHFVYKNGVALLSRYNSIYRYDGATHTIEKLFSIPYTNTFNNFTKNPLLGRALRTEISHVLGLHDESILVFFDRKIYKVKEGKLLETHSITTCRRPINVYCTKNIIVWGDYIISNVPKPVNIFISKDSGCNWDLTYTFKAGEIRHIHNILFDRFRNVYWILTGDEDRESGIWSTTDFVNVEPLLIGSQKFRAVSIIPTIDGLIIPSDTPLEKNKIRFYSFQDNQVSDVADLNGSCMFASQVNREMFVSTMCEPSLVNKHKFTELWHSRDGFKWKKVLSAKKDCLPVKLFQFPWINIPKYESGYNNNDYYFSMRCVLGGMRTVIINEKDLGQ
ncbi:MAG: hypothetical protein NPIRA02_42050 [Nitrospirales bacterium]|nr:MAG: hypothetical protein NPIRA02_42050 [Nitrospirales bacterium]